MLGPKELRFQFLGTWLFCLKRLEFSVPGQLCAQSAMVFRGLCSLCALLDQPVADITPAVESFPLSLLSPGNSILITLLTTFSSQTSLSSYPLT